MSANDPIDTCQFQHIFYYKQHKNEYFCVCLALGTKDSFQAVRTQAVRTADDARADLIGATAEDVPVAPSKVPTAWI